MNNKSINKLVKKLKDEMFDWWRMRRYFDSGFENDHEQDLYDALCRYSTEEEKGKKEEA